jgi:DNA polymerase delta subunit 1
MHDRQDNLVKVVFTLGTCDNIVDAQVKCFDSEKEMLLAWEKLMYVCDPDIITGYNIINFDFPYILARAKHLNIHNYGRLGRYLCNLS